MRRALIAALLVASMAATAMADYDFEDAFPLLPTFVEPLELQDPLDGTDRLFVGEKAGKISVFANDPSASSVTVYLDIADSVTNNWESGLLGFTFDPDYENNGYVYVAYETKAPQRTKLSRFTVSANPNVCNRASEVSLLEVRQFVLYHKAGCLAFGADGYLYVTIGDDGSPYIPQDLTSFKGKMIRIDVHNPSGGKNYGIPPNNPFAGNTQGKLEEIWAYGFRNPWRFSFDDWTGRLWLADVGLDTWEEINIVTKGRNYGWGRLEGTTCMYPAVCDTAGLNIVLPLWEYPHTSEFGGAVMGGFVYRGTRVASLNGNYLYTDHAAGDVWGLTWDGVNAPVNRLLLPADPTQRYRFDDLCQDKDREIFWVSYINGRIWRIEEVPSAVGASPPARERLLAHPNPFSGRATIHYATDAPATLEVYDVRGMLVTRLADRVRGEGDATWDGTDRAGRSAVSGIYFVRLTRDGQPVVMTRLVLLK